MANARGGYDITFFAQEALIQLENALGFAARVHRGYSPTPQQRGQTISIPRPSTFTAQNAPSSAQDLAAGEVQITLNQWREVKFALTDAELHYSREQIIRDHIRPSAYALANDMGGKLSALYKDIPWFYKVDTSTVINNILQPRKQLRDNGVPIDDGMVHLGLDATEEARFLAQSFMHAQDVTGGAGADTLLRGSLGTRFGIEMFADGTIQQHAAGTVVTAGNDNAGALTADADTGATSIAIGSLSGTETLKAGDTFVIASNTQRYVVTADATLSTGAATISIFPALVQDYSSGAVVTFENGSAGANNADAYYANLMFHKNAFALATAPLLGEAGTMQARQQGIQVEQVVSPESALSLRARLWYDADNSKTVVALDILYGYKTLDANMAVVLRGDV